MKVTSQAGLGKATDTHIPIMNVKQVHDSWSGIRIGGGYPVKRWSEIAGATIAVALVGAVAAAAYPLRARRPGGSARPDEVDATATEPVTPANLPRRHWARKALVAVGTFLFASAMALNAALLVYGDPAALPGPLGTIASEHVMPWAQDEVLPWMERLGVRVGDANAAETASETPQEEAAVPDADSVPVEEELNEEKQPVQVPPATPNQVSPSFDAQSAAAPAPVPTGTPKVSAAPRRIAATGIGLDAPVIRVGVDKSGAMGTPRTAWEVGWYGVKPGETGNALLTGHVDWVVNGKVSKGSFYSLHRLEPGDILTISDADGKALRFAVEWKRYYDAASAPVDDITGPTGEPAITLITCGGPFDRTLKTYLGRWVVRAALLSE